MNKFLKVAILLQCRNGRLMVSLGLRQGPRGFFHDPQTNLSVDYITQSNFTILNVLSDDEGYWAFTGKNYGSYGTKTISRVYAKRETKFKYKETCFSCTSHKRPTLFVRGLCPEVITSVKRLGYFSVLGRVDWRIRRRGARNKQLLVDF